MILVLLFLLLQGSAVQSRNYISSQGDVSIRDLKEIIVQDSIRSVPANSFYMTSRVAEKTMVTLMESLPLGCLVTTLSTTYSPGSFNEKECQPVGYTTPYNEWIRTWKIKTDAAAIVQLLHSHQRYKKALPSNVAIFDSKIQTSFQIALWNVKSLDVMIVRVDVKIDLSNLQNWLQFVGPRTVPSDNTRAVVQKRSCPADTFINSIHSSSDDLVLVCSDSTQVIIPNASISPLSIDCSNDYGINGIRYVRRGEKESSTELVKGYAPTCTKSSQTQKPNMVFTCPVKSVASGLYLLKEPNGSIQKFTLVCDEVIIKRDDLRLSISNQRVSINSSDPFINLMSLNPDVQIPYGEAAIDFVIANIEDKTQYWIEELLNNGLWKQLISPVSSNVTIDFSRLRIKFAPDLPLYSHLNLQLYLKATTPFGHIINGPNSFLRLECTGSVTQDRKRYGPATRKSWIIKLIFSPFQAVDTFLCVISIGIIIFLALQKGFTLFNKYYLDSLFDQ